MGTVDTKSECTAKSTVVSGSLAEYTEGVAIEPCTDRCVLASCKVGASVCTEGVATEFSALGQKLVLPGDVFPRCFFLYLLS